MNGAATFLRFSRDKRGYEHFYLVQPTTNRRGKTRSRILYWFRTPPGVKVGRTAFDVQARRAIEAQNPGVTFDWKRLLATPIPPPTADAERWRDRRRVERADRAARRAEESAEGAADSAGTPAEDVSVADAEPTAAFEPEGPEGIDASLVVAAAAEPAAQPARRRRRRRRGGRRTAQPGQPTAAADGVLQQPDAGVDSAAADESDAAGESDAE